MPGAASGREVRTQLKNPAPSGSGGTPGARDGIGGIAERARGTGFACVPRASCVPSLSIAPAP
ncbi:hypothetical protein TUSST3_82940 [Streptomyces sp. TUS-ST3]|nr:hypothetical protein TUSST3_82940 [Streptomyces sp. TUS-ST3]